MHSGAAPGPPPPTVRHEGGALPGTRPGRAPRDPGTPTAARTCRRTGAERAQRGARAQVRATRRPASTSPPRPGPAVMTP